MAKETNLNLATAPVGTLHGHAAREYAAPSGAMVSRGQILSNAEEVLEPAHG